MEAYKACMAEIISEAAAQMYLDLIKKCLTRFIFSETYQPIKGRPSRPLHPIAWAMYPLYPMVASVLAKMNLKLFLYRPVDQATLAARADGKDWPAEADTMIGLKRLENLQYCVTEVIRKNVTGDLIETGVWRGGASIFMRAILKMYGDETRTVWVADSFPVSARCGRRALESKSYSRRLSGTGEGELCALWPA
jgi:O-methyltransferase